MKWTLLASLLLAAVNCTQAQAGVYKWTDNNGRVHFSDRAPSADISSEEIKIRRQHSSASGDVNEDGSQHPALILYTENTCVFSDAARSYLQEHNIAFEERNMDTSAEARAEFIELKGKKVPLIVDGTNMLHGFSSVAFERFYQPAQVAGE